MFLLILILIACAILPLYGFYTPQSVALVLLSFGLLVVSIFGKFSLGHYERNVRLGLILIFLLLTSISWGGVFQDQLSFIIGKCVVFTFLFGIVICTYFRKRFPIVGIFIVYLVLTITIIVSSPTPLVDTVVILEQAPLAFVQGKNPYSEIFTQQYTQEIAGTFDYYNYLPGSFIYLSPFVLLFQDHRYAVVITQLLGGWLLYLYFRSCLSHQRLVLLLCFFFFLPGTGYIVEFGYLDAIIVSFFIAYEYFRKRETKGVATFMLGCFSSIKQPPLLSIPFLLRTPSRLELRYILFAALIPATLIAVYLYLNFQAFLFDTVFGLSPSNITSPIEYSLTLKTWLIKGLGISSAIAVPIVLTLFSLIYVLLLFKKMSYLDKLLLFFMAFNLFTYHAFFNSYYLVMLFLVYKIGLEWSSYDHRLL